MALLDRLDATTRKFLTMSRNRLASVFLREVPDLAAPLQDAAIDIMEPLTIGSGQQQNVAFRYLTGVPAATAFGMIWWDSEAHARAGYPPLVHTEDMPTQTFLPDVPQPNTGDFQEGIVAIRVPAIDVAREDFFGRIIIYQA